MAPAAKRSALVAELILLEHLWRRKNGELPTLEEYEKRFLYHLDVVREALFTNKHDGGCQYLLIRPLEKGGQGTVYLARDNDDGEHVAIKVLTKPTREHRKQFRREAKNLKRAKDPRIVAILDEFEEGGQPFIVMEYIAGGSLKDKLKRDGPIPPMDAARLIAKIADAVFVLHKSSKGPSSVLHRDLKPANILLDRAGELGEPYLVDLGLSCLARDVIGSRASAAGTAEYLSPEQARAQLHERPGTVDTRTDVWALGAIQGERVKSYLCY